MEKETGINWDEALHEQWRGDSYIVASTVDAPAGWTADHSANGGEAIIPGWNPGRRNAWDLQVAETGQFR